MIQKLLLFSEVAHLCKSCCMITFAINRIDMCVQLNVAFYNIKIIYLQIHYVTLFHLLGYSS